MLPGKQALAMALDIQSAVKPSPQFSSCRGLFRLCKFRSRNLHNLTGSASNDNTLLSLDMTSCRQGPLVPIQATRSHTIAMCVACHKLGISDSQTQHSTGAVVQCNRPSYHCCCNAAAACVTGWDDSTYYLPLFCMSLQLLLVSLRSVMLNRLSKISKPMRCVYSSVD